MELRGKRCCKFCEEVMKKLENDNHEETIEEGQQRLFMWLEMKTWVKKRMLLKDAEDGWPQWRKKTSTVHGLEW